MGNIQTIGGYKGRILRVDLDNKSFADQIIDKNMVNNFLGGNGLASKFLYDEVPPGTGPYDRENRLIFMTGPLSGTLAPGSCTISVVTKSPMIDIGCAAQSNGNFAARLKYAGYDGIVIKGISPKPVYLHIDNGKVELADASELWGKDTYETDLYLRERYSEKLVDIALSVASIGPAGENLIRFSGIIFDQGHIAAKGGVGAVMGSKKLKAIVVRGRGGVLAKEGNESKFRDCCLKWKKELMNVPGAQLYSKFGTAGVVNIFHELGWLPVRNLTSNIFEEHEKFDGHYLRSTFKTKPRSCHSCPLAHTHVCEVTEGPYKGFKADEPDYEILANFGPSIGNLDPGSVVKINNVIDRMGMNGNEAGFLISMLMECFENKIISEKDLDGVKLNWGNIPGIITILEKICKREGIGNILAEGTMRSAKKLGKKVEEVAVYFKNGEAPHGLDPRGAWGMLFTQAISSEGSWEGYFLERGAAPLLGFPEPLKSWSEELVPKAAAKTGFKRQYEESLGVCVFVSRDCVMTVLETLNALTGFEFSLDDALKIGERTITLLRTFGIRHGLTPDKDDTLSPRISEAPRNGPAKGIGIASSYPNMLRSFYKEMGWDEMTSRPLPETLRRLDLEYVIKDIWER